MKKIWIVALSLSVNYNAYAEKESVIKK